jgi:hypothetical protein
MNFKKTAASILNAAGPALIGLIVYILLLSYPLHRQIGLTIRYDLYLLTALVFLPGYLVFRLPGFAGRALAITFTLVLFALPLSGLWASGQTEEYVIGGLFPWSDAGHYYFDALNLLTGWTISQTNAARPIFPTLLAALLGLSGQNLPITLLILTLAPAFAAYLATREVQRSHGTFAGMIFFLLAFCYARVYVGTTLSENLGFALGMAAFTLLWRCARTSRDGAHRHWLWTGLGGVFLLSLGLFARQGAFFALLFIVVWLAWLAREKSWISWKVLVLGFCAAGAGFLANSYVSVWTTEPENRTSYQFAMLIYSLVEGGKQWNALFADNAGLQELPSNQIMSKTLEISWDYFRSHPTDIVKGTVYYWGSYFSELGRGGFSYLDGPNETVRRLLRVALFALSGFGLLLAVWRRAKDPALLLLAVGWVGMFLSIPIVPPTNTFKLRLFATTQWLEAALPAVAVVWILSWLTQQADRFQFGRFILQKVSALARRVPAWAAQSPSVSPAGVYALSAVVIAIVLIAPPVLSINRPVQSTPATTCPAGQEAVVSNIAPRSYLVLVENDDPRKDWIPFIRRPYFINRVHNVGNVEITPEFDRLTKPTVFIYALDLVKKDRVWVFVPYNLFPFETGKVQMCGHYTQEPTWRSYYFFYADSLQMLQ